MGEKTDKIYIYVHGKMSSKEEAGSFAAKAAKRGYQVLSFDLPEHGDRKNDGSYRFNAWNAVSDLDIIGGYVSERWRKIGLFACSIGAYFGLLAYKTMPLCKCLFLSPILDMVKLIDNMKLRFNVSDDELREKKEIPTPQGETLSWDYYLYAKENPIVKWDAPTSILYGSADNLTERNTVDDFSKRFNCDLTVFEGGEHYFHTEEQLHFYNQWLDKNIE